MGADEMIRVGKSYWIWLAQAIGFGAKTEDIFSVYENPYEIYSATQKKRSNSDVFSKQQLDRFKTASLEEAQKIVDECERRGWKIVTPEDKEYPAGLRRISDMPLVLYVDGDISCLRGKVMIAVVGTRNPGADGLTVTRKISSDLSTAGAIVVSGGALGIDRAAHESALAAGGKTVCVLGCGFGTGYLMENEEMRREIAKNGAVVTEYPPRTSASKYTFPKRNRIISGMSHGVLVVEAGERSGSLITARLAGEQGRDVFTVPGSVLSSAYTGANRLLSDGAKAVVDAKEILKSYASIYPDRLDIGFIFDDPNIIIEKRKIEGADADMQAAYDCLSEEPVHFNEILAMTGMNSPELVTALMKLQIMGYIEENESKRYTAV